MLGQSRDGRRAHAQTRKNSVLKPETFRAQTRKSEAIKHIRGLHRHARLVRQAAQGGGGCRPQQVQRQRGRPGRARHGQCPALPTQGVPRQVLRRVDEEARPLPALVRVDGAGQALRRLARLDALGPGGQRKVLDTQEVAVRGAAAVLGLPGGEGARGRRRVPLAAGGRIRTGLTALLAIPNYK